MSATAIILCVVAQLFLVVGQILLKHAMDEKHPLPRHRKIRSLALGVASQAVWFFLWLGLLQSWDLSRIFPFEGLNPLLLVLGAWLILRERLTVESWIGIALITAGISVVASR